MLRHRYLLDFVKEHLFIKFFCPKHLGAFSF